LALKLTVPLPDTDIETGAILFLKEHAPNLGHADVDLELVYRIESITGIHLTYQQLFHGVPIYSSEIKVNLNKNGTTRSYSDLSYDVDSWQAAMTIPAENESMIKSIAEDFVENNYDGPINLEYAAVILPREPDPSIIVQLKVRDHAINTIEEILIELDGEVVLRKDLNIYAMPVDSAVTGMIFYPDPLTSAEVTYGGAYVDNGDNEVAVLNAERKSVSMTVDYVLATFYLRNANVEMVELSPPVISPPTPLMPDFDFTRGEDGFEDVNAYWHLTNYNDYLVSIGCTTIANFLVQVDAHGSSKDKSWFDPNTTPPRIYFGEGGVDDAEDADVIVHEYGHALSYRAAPGTLVGIERSAIDEGLGDYIAASYSRSISEFRWADVFTWDGHNEYWPGRTAASNKHYPEDFKNDKWQNGEIWSSVLMEIWGELGRETTDKLVFESIFSWYSNMDMPSAAELIFEVDSALNGNQNFLTLYIYFLSRGLIKPANLIDMNGCQFHDSSSLDAGMGTTMCAWDTLVLGGSPTGPDSTVYLWIPGEDLDDNTSANPVLSATQDEVFTVYVMDTTTGCIKKDSIAITLYPIPQLDLGPDTIKCFHDQFTLDAGSGFNSYLWSDSSTNQTFKVTYSSTYHVTISDALNCTNSDTINVAHKPCQTISIVNTEDFKIGNGSLLIQFPTSTENATVEFYDMLGRLVGKITHPSNETISVEGDFLGTGLYLINVTTFDVVNGRPRELDKLTQKIVKLR